MLLCQMVVCSSLLSFSQTSKEWAITVNLSNTVALRRVLGVSLLAVSVLAANTKIVRSRFPQDQRRFVHKDLAEADAKHRRALTGPQRLLTMTGLTAFCRHRQVLAYLEQCSSSSAVGVGGRSGSGSGSGRRGLTRREYKLAPGCC